MNYHHPIELQLFEKTQTPVFMLTSQALYLGNIALHVLELLLHVQAIFAQQIICRLKLTLPVPIPDEEEKLS